VRALDDLAAPHPLSAKLAVATLKRYLAEDRHRIRLDDLLAEEVSRVEQETSIEAMPVGPDQDTGQDATRARLAKYEAICETLVALMAVGGRWATEDQLHVFTGVLERLGNRWPSPREGSTLVVYGELLDYPATLALYGAGLGAVAGDRLEALAHILGDVTITRHGRRKPLLHEIAPTEVVEGRILDPSGRQYTPVSDHLAEVLREPLRELIPRDEAFIELFDRFEYLLSIAYADLGAGEAIGEYEWAPAGSYAWRRRYDRGEEGGFHHRFESEAREAETRPDGWSFLRGPLFDCGLDRFLEVKRAVDAHLGRLRTW
jgi:hypothetical protein